MWPNSTISFLLINISGSFNIFLEYCTCNSKDGCNVGSISKSSWLVFGASITFFIVRTFAYWLWQIDDDMKIAQKPASKCISLANVNRFPSKFIHNRISGLKINFSISYLLFDILFQQNMPLEYTVRYKYLQGLRTYIYMDGVI